MKLRALFIPSHASNEALSLSACKADVVVEELLLTVTVKRSSLSRGTVPTRHGRPPRQRHSSSNRTRLAVYSIRVRREWKRRQRPLTYALSKQLDRSGHGRNADSVFHLQARL